MTIGGTLLLHGEKWAASVQDAHTLRRIREMLLGSIAEHERIVATILDDEARADYEATFAEDVRRCRAVIETCERRLKEEYGK